MGKKQTSFAIPEKKAKQHTGGLKFSARTDRLEADAVDGGSGDIYSDDSAEEERQSTSPSKLTARQRAKGNKDLQETLVSLPGEWVSWCMCVMKALFCC